MNSQHFDQSRVELVAAILLPLSLFSLAAAIVYFTYQAVLISKHIPEVLLSINATSEQIEPMIDEFNIALKLLPEVLTEIEETRKVIPPILKEVALIREIVPDILQQVEQTQKQIPLIVQESAAIRADLPAALSSVDKASTAVTEVAKQVAASRSLVADALTELATTREAIPPMMEHADLLIEKARVAGREASEGAVTGLFTGIIRAPFALVAKAGRGIAGLSAEDAEDYQEKDFELIEAAAIFLLNYAAVGDERQWNNAESDNHGVVVLLQIYTDGEFSELECRSLGFKLHTKDVLNNETSRSFCKNEEGEWDFDE